MLEFGGTTDVGYGREINEDYITFRELSGGFSVAIVCDGAGSINSEMQPASLAALEVIGVLKRLADNNLDCLIQNREVMLREAIQTANRVIGAFRVANKEQYAGFGAAMTVCLFFKDEVTVGHIGNTRLYLVRKKGENAKIRQLTIDHTEANEMLQKGLLDNKDMYYSHPSRLILTSALGIVTEPVINISTFVTKPYDILLLSTDGVHYAIREEAILEFMIRAENCGAAAKVLVDVAKEEMYVDNASALVMHVAPESEG